MLYAPNGLAEISGENLTVKGSLLANKVKVTGSFRHITAECWKE